MKSDSKGTMLKNYIPYILIAIIGSTLIIRSFLSFCWSDESFYLTVVHRLWLGESLIKDEWFFSQVFAPLLLPFYSLYIMIKGNNEGIYLAFRILAVLWNIGLAYYMYHLLQKKYKAGIALSATCVYLLYSRGNIGGMSYYNMTLSFVLWAMLLIYGGIMKETSGKQLSVRMFFVGILIALAVACTPYLAIGYLPAAAILLFFKRWKKYRKCVIMILAGTFCAFIIYLIFVLARATVMEIWQSIPYILNETEMQKTHPVFAALYLPGRIIYRFKYTIFVTFLIICYTLFVKFKQHKTIEGRYIKILSVINFCVFLFNAYLSRNMVGCINIALIIFIIPYILMIGSMKKLEKEPVLLFVIPGICMICAFTFSSDTGLDAMTIGYVLVAIGAILCAASIGRENGWQKRILCTVLIATLIQTGFLRIFSVYRDDSLLKMNAQITEGPAKYLFTSKEHEKQYDEVLGVIREYVTDDDTVFYTKLCCWAYLCSNSSYGTPSSWRISLDSPRLEEYYTVNPHKIPTCVVILKPEYGQFRSVFIQGNEVVSAPNDNKKEGFLWEYMQKQEYEKIETDCAYIYKSKT